jgi:hypothetical protein
MTDGRCRFGPRAKREMVDRVLGGESARQGCWFDALFSVDGDERAGSLAAGV